MSVKLTKQDWDDIQHLKSSGNIAIARRFERALRDAYRYRELTRHKPVEAAEPHRPGWGRDAIYRPVGAWYFSETIKHDQTPKWVKGS